MALPISSTSPTGSADAQAWTDFTGATTLEAQLAVLATLLQRKETDYNRANPTENPKNRIQINPNFEEGQLNIAIDLLMTPDAVNNRLVNSIVSHVPAI